MKKNQYGVAHGQSFRIVLYFLYVNYSYNPTVWRIDKKQPTRQETDPSAATQTTHLTEDARTIYVSPEVAEWRVASI